MTTTCPTPHETSVEARPSEVDCDRRREQILDTLRTGDLTVEEFCDMMRVDKGAYAPRFTELSDAKEIFPSGKRRMTRSGKNATVWTTNSQRNLL